MKSILFFSFWEIFPKTVSRPVLGDSSKKLKHKMCKQYIYLSNNYDVIKKTYFMHN